MEKFLKNNENEKQLIKTFNNGARKLKHISVEDKLTQHILYAGYSPATAEEIVILYRKYNGTYPVHSWGNPEVRSPEQAIAKASLKCNWCGVPMDTEGGWYCPHCGGC